MQWSLEAYCQYVDLIIFKVSDSEEGMSFFRFVFSFHNTYAWSGEFLVKAEGEVDRFLSSVGAIIWL